MPAVALVSVLRRRVLPCSEPTVVPRLVGCRAVLAQLGPHGPSRRPIVGPCCAEGALAFRAVDTNITCQPEEAPSPAPTPVPADGDGGGGGLSGGAIAGITIGAAAGAALLACAAWWMMVRRRRGGKGSGAGRLDEEAAKRAGEPDMMTGSKEELKSSPGSTGSLLKEQLGPGSIASAATAREGSLGSRAGSGTLQPRGSLFQSRCAAEGFQALLLCSSPCQCPLEASADVWRPPQPRHVDHCVWQLSSLLLGSCL